MKNYYSGNTYYMTKKGMKLIQDINPEDEVYYIDKDNNLKSISDVSIISKETDCYYETKGRHLFIESLNSNINLFKLPISLKANIENYSFNLDNISQEIDLNGEIKMSNNLAGLIIAFYIGTCFDFSKKYNGYIQKSKFTNNLIYSISSKICNLFGLYIRGNNINYLGINKSEWIQKHSIEDCILYFYRNPTLFISFIETLEEIDLSIETKNKKAIFLTTYKNGLDIQALLSLFGYKTFLKYDKDYSMFRLTYYNYSGSNNANIKKEELRYLENKEEFYNLDLHINDVKYLIASNNKSDETCICYLPPFNS